MVEVRGGGDSPGEIEFLGKKFGLYPGDVDRLIALVPVDIDTPPQKYSMKVRYGEEKRTAFINVKEHEFETIKLTLPEGKVTLSPENRERAVREAAMLRKLWPRNSAKMWEGSFNAPLETEVSTLFGVRRIMNEKRTSVHRGMDFRGDAGEPVKAINDGKAVFCGDLFFGGNTLVIDHGTGIYSVYMHLSSIKVSEGDEVSRGEEVGLVGMSGRATGPHLHLSVKLHGVSINPGALFKLKL